MGIYRLKPIVDKTIWGNNRLNQLRYNSQDFGGTSWEISFHPYGSNLIEGSNQTLLDLLNQDSLALIGDIDVERVLRLAYLDAKDWLSIQLHPTLDYALRHDIKDYEKSEAWYIIKAQEGAYLKAGSDIENLDELKEAIENGSIVDRMIDHPVEAGDFIYLPAGTLHALGAGILAIEVSTNSNTTYRVYDFGRTDDQGNPRELHVQQVLDNVDLSLKPQLIKTEKLINQFQTLTDNEHFVVTCLDVEDHFIFDTFNNALYITVLNQGLKINGLETKIYDNLFISSEVDTIEIEGRGRLLISHSKYE